MRVAIGLDIDGPVDQTLQRARRLRERGFTRMWSSQIRGPDTLTVLALVGRELPDVNVGTSVVPIQPRHPSMLAAQARTVQDAIGGQLSLGIGLSHRVVVEGLWGMSFERPAAYMREYLDALGPMLRGENVAAQGERIRALAQGPLGPRDVRTPGLLVAALGPQMLRLAGTMTDGTVLWMTGPKTIAAHIAPTIRAAALAAGRGAPRIVCALPVSVTRDVAAARQQVNESFAIYPTLPSYAAMMKREGAKEVADVALLGSHEHVSELLTRLSDAGVTEYSASVVGSDAERDATYEVLAEFAER